jgi:hypothetical protein
MTKPSRSATVPRRLAALAALAGVVLSGCGVQEPGAAAAPPSTTAAGGHQHGATTAAGPQAPSAAEAVARSTGVKVKKSFTDSHGNEFSVWVSFGPAAQVGMCGLGGSGYTRSMLLMVQSAKSNGPAAAGPFIGAKARAVAFLDGDYKCSWALAPSGLARFKPGEAKTFTGLIEPIKGNPAKATLILTIGERGKPKKELARIPYREMLS